MIKAGEIMEIVEPIRSRSELEKIKEELRSKPRDYALFVVGTNSGLRISDLLRLKVGDVLKRTRKRDIVKDRVELREKKTRKARSIALNTSARSALRRYLLGSRPALNDPLFTSRKHSIDGKPRAIGRSQAYRIITGAAERAGVEGHFGTHTLRKTWGYHARNAGVDTPTLQKMLNHSDQDSTLRYLGILQDDMDKVYRRVTL